METNRGDAAAFDVDIQWRLVAAARRGDKKSRAPQVPHKWSLEPALGLALNCLGAPDPSTRRAGAAAVGVVAEGFQDPLREAHLGDVLQRLAACAQASTDAATRECLCFAYGQLAEHCQPEVVGFAERVVPGRRPKSLHLNQDDARLG